MIMFQIRFIVKVCTGPNQKIKIVGNIPQLGQWVPQKGLDLEYDQVQWTSPQCILIPSDKKFQFKIVKILQGDVVQWETLPSNSNRKHRPLFHSLLILKWSQAIGKIKNKSISSYMVKGFPGVMIGNKKQSNTINKKVFNPCHEAQVSSSESDQEDPYESVISRKRTVDIRASINVQDIKEMYYETTPAQNLYYSFRKTKIYLVIDQQVQNSEFFERLEKEVKEISSSGSFYFKWIIRNRFVSEHKQFFSPKKISFKMISNTQQDEKWKIEEYVQIDQNTYFIFLNLRTALQTELSSRTKACLYLPSQSYFDLQVNYEKLSEYRFVCFDSAQKNQALFNFLVQKKCSQYSESETDYPSPNNVFQNQKVSLQNIIEQLKFADETAKSINTVQNYQKGEALEKMMEENSILIVQSSLLKIDSAFFYSLLDKKYQKRFIIIYHKSQTLDHPELQKFKKQKNICIVFKDFKNFIYLNKTYEPLKKHDQIIELIKMKAKLYEQLIGGSWCINHNEFVYKLKKQDESENKKKIQKMMKEFETIINVRGANYFKIVNREKSHKLKIVWNIAHRIRLIRTLCRIKFLEEGKIGNFYLLSHETSFQDLKEELKLLVRLRYPFLANQKETQIMDFAYGQNTCANYNIQ